MTRRDRNIPVLLQRRAGENEAENQSDAVADDERHDAVHGVPEPSVDGDFAVEEQEGEFGERH